MGNVQKDIVKSSVGKIEDSRVFFVLKKTEKISSALFMITDVFNDSHNVLKKEIQEGSISLLKDISKISTNQISSKETIDKIVQSYLYIKSLVDVAEKINCISDNNRSILIKEINYCIERVNELKFNPLQLILNRELRSDDFLVDYQEKVDEVEEEKVEEKKDFVESNNRVYKGHVKDIKRTLSKKPVNNSKGQTKSRTDDKMERQDKIKAVLDRGGEMNIKDIVSNFKGVSSKTIQRDLNELIASNIVQKEGEKRWSMYSLK